MILKKNKCFLPFPETFVNVDKRHQGFENILSYSFFFKDFSWIDDLTEVDGVIFHKLSLKKYEKDV